MKIDLGCYGIPSVYEPSSEACSKCKMKGKCRAVVIKTTKTLSSVVAVKEIIVKLKSEFQIEVRLPVREAEELPKFVRSRVEKLREKGFDVSAKLLLSTKQNPFSKHASKELFFAGEMLIKGAFEKSQLRQRLESELGWSYSMSATHASKSLAIMRGLGLIKVEGKLVKLNDE